jgi:phosphoribosylformylglycinamidine synthase
MRPDALLFGESTGRVIATAADPGPLLAAAAAAGVPARRVGETGGERLRIGPSAGAAWIDTSVAKLHDLWARAIPRRLEVP